MKKFSNLNKKQQNFIKNIFRYIIQIIFFIFVPGGFVGAFTGLKNILTQLGAQSPVAINSFTVILISLLMYTIVFGRFFCGYACPFGTISDWIYDFSHFVCKKLKIKLPGINEHLAAVLKYIKYAVLLVILSLCYIGVYSNFRGTSPWDVFSRITGLNFNLKGYLIGTILLFTILIAMIFERRFFCRFLCPMGAIFSLMPILPFFTLTRNREECISTCKGCTTVCPCNVNLPDTKEISVSGECIMCERCTSVCPKQNIHYKNLGKMKTTFLFTSVRAGILLGILLYLGL